MPEDMALLVIVLLGLILVLTYFFLSGDPEPVAGVYRLPGRFYWLKRIIFYVLFRLRSLKTKRKEQTSVLDLDNSHLSNSEGVKGYGRGDGHVAMERPQPLSSDMFAIDCAYFGATNCEGYNLVFRLARRKNRTAEIWLFLEVPGLGCYQHPRHPDTDVYFSDDRNFCAGGLAFEILEPMKRWKITYKGKLRKGLCNDVTRKAEDFVEADFSFIWSAITRPFNFDTDISCSLLGDGIARESWNQDFFQRLKDNHQTHYEQWGELRGRLNMEGLDEKWLYLQSVRDHTYGRRDWRSFHRYVIHFVYLQSGMTLQVGVVSQPDLMSHLKIGYVSYANGDIFSVDEISLNLWELAEKSKDPPKYWQFSFQANGQTFQVKATRGTTPVWFHHEDRGGQVMEVFTDFQINGIKGRGISEFFYRNLDGPLLAVPEGTSCPLLLEPSDEVMEQSSGRLTLLFLEVACTSSRLVGGKGAQLAQMSRIQTDVKAQVPVGFCLTLQAFALQLQKKKHLLKAVEDVAEAVRSSSLNMSAACHAAVDALCSSDIDSEIQEAILEALTITFHANVETVHVAVRSSASDEDGSEASSAGQMETVLGVVGIPQILTAIRQCWASAYTVQAVEYRRQHGQPLTALVGVVIQEMVKAETAGVMFTVNPVSGSSSSLVINANYGLGESVVSGMSDPDTIIVDRHPEFPFDTRILSISSKRAGRKQHKIIETECGGVIQVEVDQKTSSVCISDEVILQLATLGIELEKRFGSSRDVEWAIVGENIYLLQCRPVTVTTLETEEELVHEFDSPMTCDCQWLTTANISEMMPGAVTPLTLSTFIPAIEYSMQVLTMHLGARQKATYLPKCLPSFCNHHFICLLDVSTIFMTTMMVRKDSMEINLLGNLLPDFKTHQIETYFGQPRLGLLRRVLNFISMMKMWYSASCLTAQWEKRIQSYTVGADAHTARDLYQSISKQLVDYETVWVWTLINSGRSGNIATVLMSVIGGNPSEWTSDHYGDIALLLSKCDGVYSAEVPLAMQDIAQEIAKTSSNLLEMFLSTPDQEGLSLLRSYPNIDKMISDFLNRHGHRCLREAELREKSWRSAPEKFISVIKAMLKNKSYQKSERQEITVSEILGRMKTKLPYLKRLILKLLIPRAWKEVGAREWGKSVSVQMSEIFKLAYNRLSTFLHQEGMLPDSDLMYFLTHREIGHLISSRSAHLIIKAQRRRKILAIQMQKKFAKMNTSRPVAISKTTSAVENFDVDFLKGMPVSHGQVTGPARVVQSLESAGVIQPGDILVVNSTDVGWSPYFPLISGLVTELGGLISHGAVVAREYGIPCVVNVANATSIIKSGEILEINGQMGIVKRKKTE